MATFGAATSMGWITKGTLLAALLALGACSEEETPPSSGSSGTSGASASGGSSGTTGSAGSGGVAATGGSAGTTLGSGGTPTGGSGGSGGTPIPGCTPMPPATGQGTPVVSTAMIGVETADDGVYFIQTSGISRVAYGATTAEALVTGIAASTSSSPASETAFRVNATHVFWEEDESVWRAARSPGATPQALRQDLGNVSHIAVNETHLYYADRTQNRIGRIALDTLAHEQLQSDIEAQDLHLGGEFLYVSSFGAHRVVRMPVAGGMPQSLTRDADFPGGLWIDQTTIYWTNRTSIYATPIGDWQTATRLGAGTDDVGQLRTEGDRVYWRDSRGYVGWTNLDGSSCALVGGGNDIAIHGTDLYVSSGSGLTRFTR